MSDKYYFAFNPKNATKITFLDMILLFFIKTRQYEDMKYKVLNGKFYIL